MEETISYEEKKNLIKKANAVPINVRVGKMGISPELIAEIVHHLKRDGLVKVKILKNYMEEKSRFEMAETIAVRTGSLLLDVKGFVALFYLRKGKNMGANI
jgi:RNA-binding protein YhbY